MNTKLKLVVTVLVALALVGGGALYLAETTQNRGERGPGDFVYASEEALRETLPVAGATESLERSTLSERELVPGARRASVALSGRVLAIDPQGGEHSQESGTFALHVVSTPELPPREVEVHGGVFEIAELEHPGDIYISQVRLGGRLAYLDRERFGLPKNRRLELRARWLPQTTLRVVDAQSGADLEGVLLLGGLPALRDRVYPGSFEEAHVLVRAGRSPLRLPDADGQLTYWVHADGYEWAPVRIDHRAGGERQVALSAGAALRVHLPSLDSDVDLRVRVYPRAEEGFFQVLAELPPIEGQCVFEGLPAGPLQVRAEVGLWSDPPVVLGRTKAELIAGRMTESLLELNADLLREPPALLAGWLSLRGVPDELTPWLEIRPLHRPPIRTGDRQAISLDEMQEEEPATRLYRWSAGRVTPGEYSAILHPFQLAYKIEVGPYGEENALVEARPLGEVRVRVVDRDSGLDLPLPEIQWMGATPDGLRVWPLQSVDRDPELGDFRFFAPLGRISVGFFADDHEDVRRSVEVEQGVNRETLQTRPLPGIWIRLLDGEIQVPFHWGLDIAVRSVDGRGTGRMRAIDGGRCKIVVTEAGRYEIDITAPPGFEPVPTQTVDAQTSRAAELTVSLQRSR